MGPGRYTRRRRRTARADIRGPLRNTPRRSRSPAPCRHESPAGRSPRGWRSAPSGTSAGEADRLDSGARAGSAELAAGRVHARNLERELARIGRVENGALIADHAMLVPLEQRLIEALHPVLDRALGDQ